MYCVKQCGHVLRGSGVDVEGRDGEIEIAKHSIFKTFSKVAER